MSNVFSAALPDITTLWTPLRRSPNGDALFDRVACGHFLGGSSLPPFGVRASRLTEPREAWIVDGEPLQCQTDSTETEVKAHQDVPVTIATGNQSLLAFAASFGLPPAFTAWAVHGMAFMARLCDRSAGWFDGLAKMLDGLAKMLDGLAKMLDDLAKKLDRLTKTLDHPGEMLDRLTEMFDRLGFAFERLAEMFDHPV